MSPGLDRRRLVVDELLPLLGLAGFGYALPLLDLLGTNPEFLVAHRLTGTALVLAALALATLPPLAAVGLVYATSLVSPRAGRVVWTGSMLVFGALAAASLLRHLDLPSDTLRAVLAAVGSVAIVTAARRWAAARTGLTFLAASPLLAVAALAAWSPAAPIVWQGDIGPVEDVSVENPAPIVFLQLDELPVSSLLRPDGTINEERFPGFARLAASSTWYANAVAIAPNTTLSVPAALTGEVPRTGQLPSAADHPRNLFTLLGGHYDLMVDEPVTALCPPSLCSATVDWGGLANDAIGVAGQLWLPPSIRSRLPASLQRATGFDNVDVLGGDSARQRLDRAERHVDRIRSGGERPLLWYQHVVLPHVPWSLGHNGDEYPTPESLDDGPGEDGGWGGDPTLARTGLQRHLLQVGATDRLVTRLIERLEDQGLWDDALVVVVADHGAAFEPDQPYRQPTTETAQEIYRVPLFVKLPGQTLAETRTDLAYNLDLLTTVLDVVGVEADDDLDGRSIVEPVPDRAQDAALYVADGEPIHPDITVDQITALAARNRALLPLGDDWPAVAAVGPLADRVGVAVSALAVDGETDLVFALDQSAAFAEGGGVADGVRPILVSGRADGGRAPDDLLVAVDGVVAGVMGRLEEDDRYVGILDAALVGQDQQDVEVLAPVDGGRSFATVPLANP